jgi:glycosyltransferase involved in cell wall biosynthesis
MKKTTVAVFLCPETEKVWNLPYMAEQLPHISFIGYRPVMSGQVVMRPNLRYEKLAYHRHKIWEQTRLLLIPVASAESALHATEALHAGIPVLIDQKEGTLREIVGDGGVAISVGAIENWIAVTDRLMTDNAAFEIQMRGVGRVARGRSSMVQHVLPFLEQLSA